MKNTDSVQFRVIDVPMGSSAEDCERLLNVFPVSDFFPGQMLAGHEIGVPGIAHRIFFKRRANNKTT